jgi:hypothetical protein
VMAVQGNEKWIQPCLDFALDVEQTNDARRVIALLEQGQAAHQGIPA